MIRRLALRLLVAAALLAAPAPAIAQGGGTTVPSGVTADAQAPNYAPRSLRPYWHVFASFGLAWALLFGYSVSLGRRFRQLEETVDRLGRDG